MIMVYLQTSRKEWPSPSVYKTDEAVAVNAVNDDAYQTDDEYAHECKHFTPINEPLFRIFCFGDFALCVISLRWWDFNNCDHNSNNQPHLSLAWFPFSSFANCNYCIAEEDAFAVTWIRI